MTTNDKNDLVGSENGENEFQSGRRKIIIAGALLVPTIITLHGTPAWAQTDYSLMAYRYGDNAGMCKNPEFDPDATEGPASQAVIPCPGGQGHDDPGSPTQGSGPDVI